MATVHKLSEELYIDSFDLIAIHSDLESYALAYRINESAQLKLTRAFEDLAVGNCFFPLFEWKDAITEQEVYLIGNKVQVEEVGENIGLFESSSTFKTHYILEDRKEINYVLRLDANDSGLLEHLLKAVKSIEKVTMAYRLDIEIVKSKKNLIF